ncbi:MAG: hypothetical protein OXE94_10570, partial [Aestuariivita sp.]|nr:hypothetical protein [Aestuariivita sp.]
IACCLLFVGSEVYTTTKQQSITTEPAVCSELDTSIPQFDIFGILDTLGKSIRIIVNPGKISAEEIFELSQVQQS